MKQAHAFRRALASCAALAIAAGTLGAQAGQSGSFPCLPKADRDRADKLLVAARASADSRARGLRAKLAPLASDADALRRMVDEERYRGLLRSANPDGGNGAANAEYVQSLRKAESAFVSRYSATALALAPPEEATALARLLRTKAVKADLAALEKTEAALEASLPRQSARELKDLGAKFKSGGQAAYLAYLACLCESWLIDPEPFARLESAQAKSLNDSQAARRALGGIVACLSLQEKFLARPLYYSYPPLFFSNERNEDDKDAAAAFEAFLELEKGGFAELDGAWAFSDDRLRSGFLDFARFFRLLPDSAFRRLAGRFNHEGASADAPEDQALDSPGGPETAAALGMIEDFEAALGGAKPEAPALALARDPTACAILDGSERYADRKKDLLEFWEGRVLKIAAAAYPGRQARAFSCLDGGAFNAVLETREGGGEWSLPIGETEILRKLKADSLSEADRFALGRLAGCDRIVSLSPLSVLPEADAAAFSWRFRLFGGRR